MSGGRVQARGDECFFDSDVFPACQVLSQLLKAVNAGVFVHDSSGDVIDVGVLAKVAQVNIAPADDMEYDACMQLFSEHDSMVVDHDFVLSMDGRVHLLRLTGAMPSHSLKVWAWQAHPRPSHSR